MTYKRSDFLMDTLFTLLGVVIGCSVFYLLFYVPLLYDYRDLDSDYDSLETGYKSMTDEYNKTRMDKYLFEVIAEKLADEKDYILPGNETHPRYACGDFTDDLTMMLNAVGYETCHIYGDLEFFNESDGSNHVWTGLLLPLESVEGRVIPVDRYKEIYREYSREC